MSDDGPKWQPRSESGQGPAYELQARVNHHSAVSFLDGALVLTPHWDTCNLSLGRDGRIWFADIASIAVFRHELSRVLDTNCLMHDDQAHAMELQICSALRVAAAASRPNAGFIWPEVRTVARFIRYEWKLEEAPPKKEGHNEPQAPYEAGPVKAAVDPGAGKPPDGEAWRVAARSSKARAGRVRIVARRNAPKGEGK